MQDTPSHLLLWMGSGTAQQPTSTWTPPRVIKDSIRACGTGQGAVSILRLQLVGSHLILRLPTKNPGPLPQLWRPLHPGAGYRPHIPLVIIKVLRPSQSSSVGSNMGTAGRSANLNTSSPRIRRLFPSKRPSGLLHHKRCHRPPPVTLSELAHASRWGHPCFAHHPPTPSTKPSDVTPSHHLDILLTFYPFLFGRARF